MVNIARGEAKCYICIKAECQVLYFTYSMWQGNDFSVIKNFLDIHSPQLNIPSLPTLTINYIQSGQNLISSNTLLSYPVLKGQEESFESHMVLCHMRIRFYKRIIQHCSHLVVLYEQYITVFAFDPPTQNSLCIKTCHHCHDMFLHDIIMASLVDILSLHTL